MKNRQRLSHRGTQGRTADGAYLGAAYQARRAENRSKGVAARMSKDSRQKKTAGDRAIDIPSRQRKSPLRK
jgi:hypothetical protein